MLNNQTTVEYVAGMLHYVTDQLNTVVGFGELNVEDQQRLTLIAYNWGWTSDLQAAIGKYGLAGMIAWSDYDEQTLDEYLRWSSEQ